MKLYLKLFLATGIPYGLIMGLYRGDATTGLVLGSFFGLFMSLSLGTMHFIYSKKLKSYGSGNTTGVHQEKTLELQLPFYKICNLCITSLEAVNGRIVEKSEQEEGTSAKVVAKTKMTWKSFGESIQFDIHKINSDKTEVKISSKPTLGTTLVDYGRNLENIEKISDFLTDNK